MCCLLSISVFIIGCLYHMRAQVIFISVNVAEFHLLGKFQTDVVCSPCDRSDIICNFSYFQFRF